MTIDQLLQGYPEPTRQLAAALRELLFKWLPGIQENPDFSAGIIGYGYGPGYKHIVCTIILSKKGVKLGFWKGVELEDPDRLLKGAGKVHLHAEIKELRDIQNKALVLLIQHAGAAYKARRLG